MRRHHKDGVGSLPLHGWSDITRENSRVTLQGAEF